MPPQYEPLKIVVIYVFSLLIAGCASEPDEPYRGSSLALIIVEEWERPGEGTATTFSKILEEDTEGFAKGGMIGGAASGCALGAAAGVYLGPPGMELGCQVIGAAGGAVGYVVGFGTGAVVGAGEGSFAALQNELFDEDTGALLDVFKDTDPVASLEAALKQASGQWSDAALTRLEGARPSEDYIGLSRQGHGYVIVLRITDLYVSAYDVFSPGSRVHIFVEGEIVETATNERKLARYWSYSGEAVDSMELSEDDNRLLESHMAKAWAGISSDIAEDVFEPKRLWGL